MTISLESTTGLRKLELFNGLTDGEKEELLKAGRIRNYSRSSTIFMHGSPVTHFYVIISGTVQLYRTNADGEEKTIEILKAGQTMCEGEIMDSCRSHRVNANAVDDSVIIEFPLGWLKETAKKHHAFALNLLSLISQHAHLAEVEAEHQATMTAAQLVACFLQRLCILYDFTAEGFELPYSKTLIASRLGLELETFSRTLAKLKDHGIIVKGNHVAITDPAKIEAYVCGFCSIAGDCPTHQAMEKKACH